MAKDKKSDLEELKKDYIKIQKKHNLPEFEELNEDFQIEKTAEIETDFLIREVRKLVADKLASYLRFVETLLNPTNAPMFVFSIIKTLGADEKKKLSEVYEKLAKNEIRLIELDTVFSEKAEAEFIKNSHKLWQQVKKDTLKILKVVEKNLDNKFETNNKGYFG
ncbi:unnamed protein product [marine sediment metagenome]|uniref:Uncharacterized protein n=1 Tax=marine sediment metagenome TaxID=412755 RepID=X1BR98_9ZZZZ